LKELISTRSFKRTFIQKLPIKCFQEDFTLAGIRLNVIIFEIGFVKRRCTFAWFQAFGFLNPEDETDRLSRNVGNKLPLLTNRAICNTLIYVLW